MEDVILTPIYNRENYQYHECSHCKEKIYMEEDCLVPFHFEEQIKYCPFCGNKIIRYAEPKYIEKIDWSWLEEYQQVLEKAYRFLEYKIHCKMNNEEIRKLRDKSDLGREYFKGDRCITYSYGNTCDLIYYITGEKLHYTTKQKLEKEFKNK